MNFFISFSFLLKHIPAVAAPSLNHTHKNDLRCALPKFRSESNDLRCALPKFRSESIDLRCALPKFPNKIKSTLLSNRTNILIIMKTKMYLKKKNQL